MDYINRNIPLRVRTEEELDLIFNTGTSASITVPWVPPSALIDSRVGLDNTPGNTVPHVYMSGLLQVLGDVKRPHPRGRKGLSPLMRKRMRLAAIRMGVRR